MNKGDGLTRLAPGKWDARIVWRDSKKKKHDTNRPLTVSTEGGPKAEKARAVAERERIRRALTGSGDEWTVDEALAEWVPTLQNGTRQSRGPHVRRFSERFGKLKLSLVPFADVQRWLNTLTCGDHSASLYRASVLALYKYARLQGRLQGENPIEKTVARRTPKSSAQLLAELEAPLPRHALLGEEIPTFFRALQDQHPDLFPLAYCQFLLGCRWGEAAALKWTDFDWTTGVVTIRRSQGRRGVMGPPKGKKRRPTALGPTGLTFMRGHRAAMEGKGWPGCDVWAFPRPLTRRKRDYDTWPYPTAQGIVRDLLRALEIKLVCSTHAMRHSHVTLARELERDVMGRKANRDLQDTIGHASPRITEGYTDESVREARAVDHAAQFEGAQVVRLRQKK